MSVATTTPPPTAGTGQTPSVPDTNSNSVESQSQSESPMSIGGTRTVLNSFNLDTFLEIASESAQDPEFRKLAYMAAQNKGGDTILDVGSEEVATMLTQSALSKMETLQDLQTKEDQNGITTWVNEQKEKITKLIGEWETNTHTKMEDWGKGLSEELASGAGTNNGSPSPSASAGSQASSTSSPSSANTLSGFSKGDLRETEITRWNLPELVTTYTNNGRHDSDFPGIQEFLYKTLPPNDIKVRTDMESVQIGKELKVLLPSKFSDYLTKISNDHNIEFKTLSEDKSITKEQLKLWDEMKYQTMNNALHIWKYAHKASDGTKLSNSTTSTPNIHRRPITEAKEIANSLNQEQVKEIDQIMSNPDTGPSKSDKEWHIAYRAAKTAFGYGEHGMKCDKEDVYRSKRTWRILTPNSRYLEDLNETYLGGSTIGTAAPTVSAAA